MSTTTKLLPLLAVLVGIGCSDASPTSPTRSIAPSTQAEADRSTQSGERLVAIGTSITMGWASNGVYAGSQVGAWPALIGFGSEHAISLPLIQSPGCTSPIAAPIGAGLRLSGESIAGSTTCAANAAGVTLPTQNVALAGALVIDVLLTTPQAVASSFPWFGRVLPADATPLTAALAQQPTIVSVELGGNEVLNATSGLFAPGVTVVPFPYFAGPYDALLNAIGSTGAKAVLIGLPSEARNLPALRRGDEIWADRAEFAALHVDVSNDCEQSPNYINVSIKSLDMVFTGAFTFAHGYPNPVFSCADVPNTQDLVLTPADIAAINALLGQMTDNIRAQAAARGYAYFSLGALYDRPNLKPATYSVISQLTSSTPFGSFISLDGVHPSPVGHAVLADAAVRAINATYGHDAAGHGSVAHLLGGVSDLISENRFPEPVLPSVALGQDRLSATRGAGVHLSSCGMPGNCTVARAMTSR